MKEKNYVLRDETIIEFFNVLKTKYIVLGPKIEVRGGRYCDDDVIMYRNIDSFEQLEHTKKSTYSPKETLTPMTENLYYFTETTYQESEMPYKKPVLVFARTCDINAVAYQDDIYLNNGYYKDYFYQRRKEYVHYALMECSNNLDENCFCVSAGSNHTEKFDFAFRFNDDGSILAKVRDEELFDLLENIDNIEFNLEFPEKNDFTVNWPDVANNEEANQISNHPLWDEYDRRCIGCGACTTACSTCTCFTTTDITYTTNRHVGERRRTNASCMVKNFDEVAGGAHFRNSIKDRYRYKIMHKVYSHNQRFKTGAMCVGCGRCSAHCPQLISYPTTINKVNQALVEIRESKEEELV